MGRGGSDVEFDLDDIVRVGIAESDDPLADTPAGRDQAARRLFRTAVADIPAMATSMGTLRGVRLLFARHPDVRKGLVSAPASAEKQALLNALVAVALVEERHWDDQGSIPKVDTAEKALQTRYIELVWGLGLNSLDLMSGNSLPQPNAKAIAANLMDDLEYGLSESDSESDAVAAERITERLEATTRSSLVTYASFQLGEATSHDAWARLFDTPHDKGDRFYGFEMLKEEILKLNPDAFANRPARTQLEAAIRSSVEDQNRIRFLTEVIATNYPEALAAFYKKRYSARNATVQDIIDFVDKYHPTLADKPRFRKRPPE